MKAVYVLLCILPHVIVGNIFRQQKQQQNPQMVIKPLDFIDQYQYTPSSDSDSHSHEHSKETNQDIASYIQKYVEVLKYPQYENQYNTHQQRNGQKLNNEQRYTQQMRNNQMPNNDYYNQRRESLEQDTKQRVIKKIKTPRFNLQVSQDEVNNQQWNRERDSQERVNAELYAPRLVKIQKDATYNGDDSKQQLNNEKRSTQKSQWNREGDSQEQVNTGLYKPRQAKIQKDATYYGDESQQLPNNEKRTIQKSPVRGDIATYGDPINWNGVLMAAGPNSVVNEKEDIEKMFSDAYNTMRHVSEEEKMKNHEMYEVAARTENEDARLNAKELLQKYQYPVEEHTVQTDDGYILTLFRISSTQQSQDVQNKPVVFLMHGLLGSADDWLLMGPGKSLAYMLADAGNDVWLGNARGNKYSRRHVSKHSALPEFWQFSNDEIALHDLPSMIDYVLQTSQQQKLHFIGYSAGTTAFFALAAARPTYNDKIIMMHALSPMVYMTHVRSPLVKMIAPSSQFSERLYKQLGSGEFRPSKELLSTVGGAMLENEIGCKNISSNVNFVMSGVNMDELDWSLIPVAMGHLPAGGSIRQMKQYGQAVASRDFRMYDFGSQNEKVYNSRLPTKYELSAVSTPVALYFSEEDWLASPVDVARLQKELPTVTDSFKVPVKHFGSMDFLLARSAPEVVYKRIIDSIQKNTTY